MVPIVQLVRASDCGSECRRFESDWAPSRTNPRYFGDFLFLDTGVNPSEASLVVIPSEVALFVIPSEVEGSFILKK